ncbi:hypothetical protein [Bradyrhizobium sp. Tv2a-2]|uniref:hypothetical protein n=1 Tax=Bradyrhizobium sp. Tv2a-2 TaxID=113395 RepID=UPI00040060DF|nr:hypothetical protein [Bradyrhizobium sp. Tv2a-2]
MTVKMNPPLCYIVVPAAERGERIGIVKRGETGYYTTDLDDGSLPTIASSGLSVEAFVRHMNSRLGVTEDEMLHMITQSMRKEA